MYRGHKLINLGIILSVLAIITVGVIWALPGAVIEIAGHGSVRFTDELLIEDIAPVSNTQINLRLSPNTNAVPDQSYLCTLYLDGEVSGVAITAWTDVEIPGTVRTLIYTGLDLVPVIDIAISCRG